MSKPLRVTVLMDWAEISDDDPDFLSEATSGKTEFGVIAALRELGHSVAIVAAHDNVHELVQNLTASAPDVVFNLTEQFRLDRRLDTNVAGLLELMGIPFTGAGSAGLFLARDKSLSKQVLGYHRIRVPGFTTFRPGQRISLPKALRFPLVVKPAYTDGSEGISNASLVTLPEGLNDRVRFIHEHWKQTAIVEEYVEGRELYVSVIGRTRLTVLPGREIFFNDPGGQGPVLATYRVKWDKDYQEKWKIRFGSAELDDQTFARIAHVCKKVFRLMQLRDYGRIDLRLTPEGRILIIEVNPNPDIAYSEEVAESAEHAGIAYPALISKIVNAAIKRGAA
ncbi:MAG: ATP-grasp domain-containing protein [Verrucomicrobia bacterium]|nr:ATP-grasp domain-containing protein [Verrucomicrobiota bacterium]